MRRKDKLPELLAPAGDFECLVAAVKGGADAIYIGGKMFSARAYAKNFDIDEIKRAVSYCHLHGVRLYVTMNILVFDNELSEALAFAKELYIAGVDALIIADLGLISLIRRRIPDFELHASTQMSVNNSVGADFAYDLGCTRVVLARELSGKNMRDVTERCKAETEVFLHGALCVCHSGQCLFSSMIGGRSGNRGECAQPCRLPYNNGKYILSLSDLSLADHISELIESGVASLKIEGRMKSPDYVYTVTSIYRRLLDEGRNSTKDENRRLERIFSRGGFTDGYFVGNTFSRMTGVRTDEDKRTSMSEEKGDFSLERTPVRARVTMRLGEPSRMVLAGIYTDREVEALGDAPSPAINAPLNPVAVKERIAKMGNTFLSLSVDDIDLELDEGVNLSPSAINKLRRDAAEKFEFFGRSFDETNAGITAKNNTSPAVFDEKALERTAIFFKTDSLRTLDADTCRYFDAIFVPLMEYKDMSSLANGVYVPPVIMEQELDTIRTMLASAKELGAEYALVGNPSHAELVRCAGLSPVGDFRLNVTNEAALDEWRKVGVSDVMLSPELTSKQVRRLDGRAIVYGRVPLMITERCFMKENFGCDKCGKCNLSDRKGISFPMMREFEHRNIIFNSAVTYMGDRIDEIRGAVRGHHFIFTTERRDEVRSVVRAFKEKRPFPLDGQFRRMGKRKVD
jgi:putative protease